MKIKFGVLVAVLFLCTSMASATSTSIRISSNYGDHGIEVDPTIAATSSDGFQEELGCSSSFFEEHDPETCTGATDYQLLIEVPSSSVGSSYQVTLTGGAAFSSPTAVGLICNSSFGGSGGSLAGGAGITPWLPSDDPATDGTACSDLTSSLSSLSTDEQGCISDLVPANTSGSSFTFTVPSCGTSWIVVDETAEEFATIGPATGTPAPEPGAASLLLIGLLSLCFFRKRISAA